MHALFVSQIFGSSQRHFRSSDPLNGRVVREIHKKDCSGNGPGFAEVADKVVGFFEGNAHCSKHNGEFLIFAKHLGLTGNLGRQTRMR